MKPFPESLNSLKGRHILVTGGAGFIGSNIVEALLKIGAKVRVLDNLSTGFFKNIEEFVTGYPVGDFSFIEGDICDAETCSKALENIDAVCHQAALGSVPRSIEFPLKTHEVNATGFLNILHTSKAKGIKRFVFASSSSVYGDSLISPKVIGSEGRLLSPYAVTKQLNEMYAGVYMQLHGMETVGLRYFNVFGPKQDPNGVYAAAIPKFIDKMIKGDELIVNGDGEQTRDFTYVRNAVKANLLALSADNEAAFGRVFNVACGHYFSLNQVISAIKENLREKGLYSDQSRITHGPDRAGDIRDSLADISQTTELLNYTDLTDFNEGIGELMDYICKNQM